MTKRALSAAAVALLLAAGVARGDIDRTQYREVTDGGQRTTLVMTVPEIVRRNYPEKVKCKGPASGDYDVYINGDGIATNVDVIRSIPGCDDYVARNLRAGRQTTRPSAAFVQRVTVDLRFEAPERADAKPKNVPPHALDVWAIERETPHLPDAVLQKHAGGGEITVSYYVTVGRDGRVSAVDPLTPQPEIDAAVTATLKRWRFKPLEIPVRSMLRFVFTIPPKKYWR